MKENRHLVSRFRFFACILASWNPSILAWIVSIAVCSNGLGTYYRAYSRVPTRDMAVEFLDSVRSCCRLLLPSHCGSKAIRGF